MKEKRKKEIRSIAIDPGVWEDVRAAADKGRVSASWLTETALRDYLARSRREGMRKAKPPRVMSTQS